MGLAGCLGGSGGSAPDTLRVAPWSGPYAEYFEEAVAVPYEEETGVTVELTPQWAEMLAKIRAAPADDPPYDVFAGAGKQLFQATADDLIAEVDVDNIPNLDEVYPVFREEFRTEYLDYGVPVDGTSYAIVYDTERVGFEPESWADLMREEVTKGSLDRGNWTTAMGIAAIISDEKPGNEELYDPDAHDAILSVIEELDEHHVSKWIEGGAEFWQALRQGTVTLGMFYFGSGLGRVREMDGVEMTLPAKTDGYFDHWVRVRGTDDKRELIEDFMNYLLSADVQTEWTRLGNNFMSNQNATYPDRTAEAYPSSNDGYATMVNSFADWERLEPHVEELNQRFKEALAR